MERTLRLAVLTASLAAPAGAQTVTGVSVVPGAMSHAPAPAKRKVVRTEPPAAQAPAGTPSGPLASTFGVGLALVLAGLERERRQRESARRRR